MALIRKHIAMLPSFPDRFFASASQAALSSDSQDTLVWPPPKIADNVPLERLLEAQKLLQRRQRAGQPQADGEASSASSSARRQGSIKTQAASKGSAPKAGARVAELVRGLLATRDIQMARMDRDTIEKLRVVDLRQVLAALALPQSGLKSSLVDSVWKAAQREHVMDWSTQLPRTQTTKMTTEAQAGRPVTEGEAPHCQMPFSHVVTGSQVAEMLKDAKADDVTVLDVRPRQCDFTDEIVIATARSKLHCQTAAQAVVYRLKQACKEIAPGIPPRIEGMGVSHHANTDWLVVDCGSVIAHIFQGQEARMQYNLEKLWADPASRGQADSDFAM